MNDNLVDGLRSIAGRHVFTTREEIIPFLSDASYFEGDTPVAVVLPSTTEEVSRKMGLCSKTGTPVLVRGGGTSLTGSSILKGEGIVISMNRFDRVLETSIDDKYVVAEPGVRLDELNAQLEKHRHFYPPDPASSKSATVGGTISTNAGGLRAAMYGTTKNWVLGLEVVMPDGEVLNLGGKTLKRTAGYDLTSLMVGSEGTLAIITKATLKIWPIPEMRGRCAAYYRSVDAVGEAVLDLKREGVTPLIAEFIDETTMNSITRIRGLKFPKGASYMLIIDIASTRESMDRELEGVSSVLKRFDPIEVTSTTDKDEMEILYEARKGAYGALLTERKTPAQRVVIGDVVVPVTHLADALKETTARMGELKIYGGLIGHVGDGNIHANIFADLGDSGEMERVEKFQREFAAIAIRHGGSVSAEHGIGQEKIELLVDEMKGTGSMGTLALMKRLKLMFDPANILNRGKMFDSVSQEVGGKNEPKQAS